MGGSGGRRRRKGRGRKRRGGLYLLEPVLLVALRHSAAHGYSLLREIEDFGFVALDPSIVYRVLRQMELDGWVTSSWDRDRTQGPPRRVYMLSQLGEEVLDEWIEELRNVNEKTGRLLENIELTKMEGGSSDA